MQPRRRAPGHAPRLLSSSATTSPPVQRVEYSLDASRWRLVYPKDGIPDSRREEFEVTLEESEVGRSVIIRATDAMNNVATARPTASQTLTPNRRVQ